MQKILLVEDNKNVCLNIETFLEDEGFNVKSVFNGEDALKEVESFKPDLGIIDIRLPGIDGNTVIEKALVNNPNMKVIVFTGYLEYSVPPNLAEKGITEKNILFKPLDKMEKLLNLVNTILKP